MVLTFPARCLESQMTDQAREAVDAAAVWPGSPSKSPSRKGPGFQAGFRVTPAAIKKLDFCVRARATLNSVTTCVPVTCSRGEIVGILTLNDERRRVGAEGLPRQRAAGGVCRPLPSPPSQLKNKCRWEQKRRRQPGLVGRVLLLSERAS